MYAIEHITLTSFTAKFTLYVQCVLCIN